MKIVLAVLLVLATSSWAQAPAAPIQTPVQGKCSECGVVRTVRAINKEERPTAADNTRPSGLVATIPFGKDAGPPQLGSSQKIGRESVKISTRWEVVVRLDDGRFQVVMMDEEPDLREGDKVRIDEGRVARRED